MNLQQFIDTVYAWPRDATIMALVTEHESDLNQLTREWQVCWTKLEIKEVKYYEDKNQIILHLNDLR